MSERPKFIHEFSKETNQEERDTLAAEIRQQRSEYFDSKTERESQVEEVTSSLEAAKKKLEEYGSEGFLSKIKNYIKKRATEQELNELRARTAELDGAPKPEYKRDQMQDEISEFYEKEKQRWVNSEYTKEDIAKQFSEEHLSTLFIDEYALLMQRFPSEMVTHVTRQGVRDHTGMIYHTAGEGEFHRGFEKIIAAGRLESPLALKLQENTKQESTLKSIKKAYDSLQDEGFPREYNDQASLHFAAEGVADSYYGSERGNEIFIAYPAAFIAANTFSSGTDPTGLNKPASFMHNDVWVQMKEEKGMDIDAALVFIPADARVNPETGSRYEVAENGVPLPNIEAANKLEQLSQHPELSELAAQLLNGDLTEDQVQEKIKEISGITDEKLLNALSYWVTLSDLSRGIDKTYAIKNILEKAGMRYAESVNTVSSKEYWESYFSEHPEKKPMKLVYYKGNDPTRALSDWQKNNLLGKRSTEANMGFSENRFNSETDVNLVKSAETSVSSLPALASERFIVLAQDIFNRHKDQIEEIEQEDKARTGQRRLEIEER